METDEKKVIEERKEKVIKFFKNNPVWIWVGVVILLVILGVYIRSLPLSDHGGTPGLWDITTNDYTLGPDLDPFLFLRYAKALITNGSLPANDMMRNVPLGFATDTELQMVSYMIVMVYKILNSFGTYSANFAGAVMPVWLFALTIIAFFLFVREIFIKRDEEESKLKANLIATISTLFMIVIPEFLSRTVAGIPEKESVAFLFMFLSFYLFLRAWKSEKLNNAVIFAFLSGVATTLMALTWGGYSYLYLTIGLTTIAAFIFGKIGKKEAIIYSIWLISSIALILSFTNRWSLIEFTTSTSNLPAVFIFLAIVTHFILWKTKVNEIKLLHKFNIPRPIISLIVAILAAIILSFIISPTFLIDQLKELNQILIKPIMGRWNTTVAENRQPYLSEWIGSFGKSFFWLFLAGSVFMFKKMLGKIEAKKAWIITALYAFFLVGLLFSRYAAHPAILDGENAISKLLYYGSALLLIITLIYFYIKDYRLQKETEFKNLDYGYLFVLILLGFSLFSARNAIRLLMVLAPIAPIFLGYLIVEPLMMFKKVIKEKLEQTTKILFLVIIIAILLMSTFTFISFYKTVKSQAYNQAPYYYTFQWQKAMGWVRDNTPTTAVFAHWWDYGYWVQSIGNRATVTDGGNAITFWNYYMGRLVLTGNNPKECFNFLYTHNATHLLIDSSDIGKYGAFSQIGSDENFDRLSQGPVTLRSDLKQVQETKNETIRTYNIPAGNNQISLLNMDEDIILEKNGSKTTLFTENSALMAITIKYSEDKNGTIFKQPSAIFLSQNQQITVPMRYLYYEGQFLDFKTGINATAYLAQRVYNSGNGLQMDKIGALVYISPRVMRGLLAQIYLLNDPFGNWKQLKLVHNQPDFILEQISQNTAMDDFVYYDNLGLLGPIKIWEIDYSGKEEINQDYLLRTQPSSITWQF